MKIVTPSPRMKSDYVILEEGYKAVYDHLSAIRLLMSGSVYPHPRDYHTSEAFDGAVKQHKERMSRVAVLAAEFAFVTLHCTLMREGKIP
jgi:hypothetical protein